MNPITYTNEPVSPRVTMSVYYNNRKVTNGCELHTLTAQTTPRVVIGGKRDEKYTLILADSDDPKYNSQENLSWLVINIPGGTTCAQGTQVVSYKGPGPGVGVHRYRFDLYKQEEKIDKIKNINILLLRGCLKTCDFAYSHKLGDPVGVTYFNVRKQPPPPAKKKT
ncbi:Phosphatidylethanolamine-binding protein PEBP [Artemisia annua]|uniref:Phosphatidylethanolamine-binding protein PEBP n=1 Tax=Artemisia annua TaxID=35608 RepID=A0A2U1P9J8_ARTAN|nr:Phosphatidylethanolamine-binding protein PEBP [Artemisia annua]